MPTFVVLTKQPSLTKQNRGWQVDWKNDSVKSSRVWWTRLVSTPRQRDGLMLIVQTDREAKKSGLRESAKSVQSELLSLPVVASMPLRHYMWTTERMLGIREDVSTKIFEWLLSLA